MSNRAATIVVVAAAISSLCLYGSFAQVPKRDRDATSGAIVGLPPARGQGLPGRYELSAVSSAGGTLELVAFA